MAESLRNEQIGKPEGVLYVARLRGARMFLNLQGGTKPHEATIRGEMVLRGDQVGNQFVPFFVQRIALTGTLDEPKSGVERFTLAGPLPEKTGLQEDEDNYWRLEDLSLKLYYSELLRKISEESVEEPQVEQLRGSFYFRPELKDDNSLEVEIANLSLLTLEKSILGLISGAILSPLSLRFVAPKLSPSEEMEEAEVDYPSGSEKGVLKSLPLRLMRTSAALTNGPPSSLNFECMIEPFVSCSPPRVIFDTIVREVALRFVNLSSNDLTVLRPACEAQVQAVCDIWGRKAGLTVSTANLFEGANKAAYANKNLSSRDCAQLDDDAYVANDQAVYVYLVDKISQALAGTGSGYTPLPGIGTSIILIAGRLLTDPEKSNPTLLAHELCHIIDLSHANGSPNSIAQPGSGGAASSAINTVQNCVSLGASDLNQVVSTATPNGGDIQTCLDRVN